MSLTVKNEGFLGLYKGLSPALFGMIIYKGIGFMIFERVQIGLEPVLSSYNARNFFAGAVASIVAQ